MEERVEALIRREVFRDGQHVKRVDDRQRRIAAEERGLLVGVKVGDNCARVHFGAGARAGRDGDVGQSLFGQRFLAARAEQNVIPNAPAVFLRNDACDSLRRVEHRAAAQADDEIATVGAPEVNALLRDGFGRVRADFVEDDEVRAPSSQFRLQLVKAAVEFRRASVRDDD